MCERCESKEEASRALLVLAKQSDEYSFAKMCDFRSTAVTILKATRRAAEFLRGHKELEPNTINTIAFIVQRASLASVNVDLLAALEAISAESFATEAKANKLIEVLPASFLGYSPRISRPVQRQSCFDFRVSTLPLQQE